MNSAYYIMIALGVVILLVPVQQSSAIFLPSPELTLEKANLYLKNARLTLELYKLEQPVNAEHARDEIFALAKEKNPYLDSPADVQVSFEDNSENMPQVINRHHEIFQTIKNEQVSLAEEKYKEILGGKTILNSINDEPTQKKTILGFKIDNQTGFLNRNHDDFQNYRLEQISIVEDFRDNNWKENFWTSNPYDNNKSIENSPKIKVNEIIQNNIIKREHKEFKNLIIEQIFQAEKIRNEMLDLRITNVQNPYLNEDIDENVDENVDKSSIKISRDSLIGWLDPTYVADKPEFNIIDRNAKGFEMVKAMEIEIAQIELNKMLHIENSENTEPSDSEQTDILISDGPFFNSYNRGDFLFEFNKNMQKMKAEKKLIEMYGNEIQNKDFDQHN